MHVLLLLCQLLRLGNLLVVQCVHSIGYKILNTGGKRKKKKKKKKKKKRTVKSVISCYTNLLSEYKIGKTIQTCFLGFQ